MSILTSASANSVYRGYEYYKSGYVLSCERISENEYEGYVKGTREVPYHIIINIEHPRKSSCDCPYAEGTNIVCKHMVAMYFYLFPEEANEYADWINSDYLDRNYYESDDERDYHSDYFQDETLPYCYDELLDEYINSISIDELKRFMKDRLNENKNSTYNNILRDRYKAYIKKHGLQIAYIDNLNTKLIKASKIYDYDYYNFNENILSDEDKHFITKQYTKNKELLNKTLLNPSLAVFLDYVWVVKFVKDKLDIKEKNAFVEQLTNLFNSLKYYGIRNTMPKSNVLICLYELNDYSPEEVAISLIKNVKYIDYAKYVIDNTINAEELYDNIIKNLNSKDTGFNKHEIPNLFLEFHDSFKSTDKLNRILLDHSYYDFLFNDNIDSLHYIYLENNDNYINKIKQNIKKPEQWMSIYCMEQDYDRLFETLEKENKEYLYDRYLKYIKDKYSEKLYDRYKTIIFTILEEGKGREIYSKAADYFARIEKLDDGKEKANKLIQELRNSKHAKKPALFDEIRKQLKN